MTRLQNSKLQWFTQKAVLCLSSSLMGIIKNALLISSDTTFLFLSFMRMSSTVTKEVCCGKSNVSFNSRKSRQILYSFDIFCSPVCCEAFVLFLNSLNSVGFGTNTTFDLHSLSDSLTTPACCNC